MHLSRSKRKPLLDHDIAVRLIAQDSDPGKPKPWCAHCGYFHVVACPRVRAMEWKGETLVRVDFWPTWDRTGCYTPEEVAEAADSGNEEQQ